MTACWRPRPPPVRRPGCRRPLRFRQRRCLTRPVVPSARRLQPPTWWRPA